MKPREVSTEKFSRPIRYVLKSYLEKITSLERELQGLKEKIFSPEDVGDWAQMESDIEGTLFDLQVAILWRM